MYVRTYVLGNQFNLKLDLPLAYYCTWLQIYALCLHPSIEPLPFITPFNWTPPLYYTLQLDPSPLWHPSIRPLPFITPFNWTTPLYYTLQLDPFSYISPCNWTPPLYFTLQFDPSPCRPSRAQCMGRLPLSLQSSSPPSSTSISLLLDWSSSSLCWPSSSSVSEVCACICDVAHEVWKYTYRHTYVCAYMYTYIHLRTHVQLAGMTNF